MREIGGYFELELGRLESRHSGAIHLNSGRNCLRYLVRAHQIEEIFAPAYTCPVIWDALRDEGCKICLYDINEDFLPKQPVRQDAWLLYTNYFGICNQQVVELRRQYPHIIVDQSQAFYAPPTENCFYSPRKFFGLPDGGLLYTQKRLAAELAQGRSSQRMSHLLQRIEDGASASYSEFRRNDASLDHEPVMQMSKLTYELLQGIHYEYALERRTSNFLYLHRALKAANEIPIHLDEFAVPMVYPYLNSSYGGAAKERLIAQKIYVATYWLGQRDPARGERLMRDMLALPIDQRYSTVEMDRILEALHGT